MKRASLLLVCFFAVSAYGVMSVTKTENTYRGVEKLRFAWTSAAGGTATSETSAAFSGRVIGVITDPGATAPTDNYDVTLLDADGDDVLLGQGANRDTANTEYLLEANLGAIAGSTVTLDIQNAGDTKQGVVVVFIEEK